jgi:hypothetical protein
MDEERGRDKKTRMRVLGLDAVSVVGTHLVGLGGGGSGGGISESGGGRGRGRMRDDVGAGRRGDGRRRVGALGVRVGDSKTGFLGVEVAPLIVSVFLALLPPTFCFFLIIIISCGVVWHWVCVCGCIVFI